VKSYLFVVTVIASGLPQIGVKGDQSDTEVRMEIQPGDTEKLSWAIFCKPGQELLYELVARSFKSETLHNVRAIFSPQEGQELQRRILLA
jgi:hypothetical protein